MSRYSRGLVFTLKKERKKKKIPDGNRETDDFREVLWKTTELLGAPYSGGSEVDCR